MFRALFVLLVCVLLQPAWAEKAAVPERADQEAAGKRIHEMFKAEFASLTAADQNALAQKLLDMSRELKGDPTAQYAMLNEVIDLASRSADLKTALTAVHLLDDRFKVDAPAIRDKALLATGRAVRTKEQAAHFVERAMPIIEARVSASEWDAAMPMIRLALAVAQANQEPVSMEEAMETLQLWSKQQVEYAKLKGSLAKLVEAPANPAANAAVGKYYALVREEWEKAVPFLARGEEGPLHAAAEQDLATMATAWGDDDASKKKLLAAQIKMGDLWLAASAKVAPTSRAPVGRRALSWYRRAEPKVLNLEHMALQKKIEDARQVIVGPGKPTFLLDLSKEQVAGVQKFRDKYYLLVVDEMNFRQAQEWAQKHGGNLVCIADKAENEFVNGLTKQGMSRTVLVGGSDAAKEGTWVWVDGSPWRYSNWGKNQPDNWKGEEPYCTMWPDGRWNDNDAKWRGAFVVQWKAN